MRLYILLFWFLLIYVHSEKLEPAKPHERLCVNLEQYQCQCTSLWDSDCDCDALSKQTQCSILCPQLCNELWKPKPLSDFDIEDCYYSTYKKYSFKFFSHAKPASDFLADMKSIMEVFNDMMDFEIVFPVYQDRNSNGTLYFDSPYGEDDVNDASYQLCVMYEYPKPEEYLPYITCINNNPPIRPNFQNCSNQHGIDLEIVESCVEKYAHELLSVTAKMARHYNIYQSTLVIADGRKINPLYFKNLTTSVELMCRLFQYPVQVFPWWVFEFLGALVISVFMIFFVVKGLSLYEMIRL